MVKSDRLNQRAQNADVGTSRATQLDQVWDRKSQVNCQQWATPVGRSRSVRGNGVATKFQ